MKSKNEMCASGEYNLSINAEVTKIVPTEYGGCATVTIDPLKNDFAWVTVQGAEVDKVTDSSGAELQISNLKVKIIQPATITFQLRNLIAGTQFTVQAEGYKSSKSTGKKAVVFADSGEFNL